jgi:hypothetical protein
MRFETTIEGYVSGRLDETDLGPVLAHCRECRDCRGLLELHRDLAALAVDRAEPDETEFESMRGRVLAQVSRDAGGERPVSSGGGFAVRGWHVAAGLAAALLLFVTGLSVGRGLASWPFAAEATHGNGRLTSRLVRAIDEEAASNRVLSDVEDSRFTYSNVAFRRVGADRLAVDFDVTTHVALEEPIDSELVRELAVQALLNPSSVGSRLKALRYASDAMEPKVIEALIFAMRRDENLAVRLQALTVLSDHLALPEVEDAVVERLRADGSVQMRLLALDTLAGHRVAPERIRELIENGEGPGNAALEIRLANWVDGGV